MILHSEHGAQPESLPDLCSGEVVRADRYRVRVGDVVVVATVEQEQRIRTLDAEQLARFRHIMGGQS